MFCSITYRQRELFLGSSKMTFNQEKGIMEGTNPIN